MALNREVRGRAFVCALGCLAMLAVSGCSSSPQSPSPRPTNRIAPVRLIVAPPQVIALANTFEDQFAARDYAVQWGELAPKDQALWPSLAARTAMLTRKFAHASVERVSIGDPILVSTWTPPEDPSLHFNDVWQFPVQVVFADPVALRPAGVAALYSMTPLQVITDPGSGLAELLGEGPEFIDAPIVLPALDPAGQARRADPDVPPRRSDPASFDRAVHLWLEARGRSHHAAEPVRCPDGISGEHPRQRDLAAASRRCTPLRTCRCRRTHL